MYWWYYLKCIAMKDPIQAFIGVTLFLTLVVFIANLVLFWRQNSLTQTLNQPLCAVKEVNVKPVHNNVTQFSVKIENYGKYVAEDASIEWDIDGLEDMRDNKTAFKLKDIQPVKVTDINILPRQEIEFIMFQWLTSEFKEKITGYAALRIKLIVEYKDMNKIGKRYSCTYRITRTAHQKQYAPEVLLIESKLKSFCPLP
jgi:hypothetical protein